MRVAGLITICTVKEDIYFYPHSQTEKCFSDIFSSLSRTGSEGVASRVLGAHIIGLSLYACDVHVVPWVYPPMPCEIRETMSTPTPLKVSWNTITGSIAF